MTVYARHRAWLIAAAAASTASLLPGYPITAGTASPPLAGDEELTTPKPGGIAPSTAPWTDAAVLSDGRTLLVRFVNACAWLDRVETTETDDSVVVTLTTSSDPAYDNASDGPLTTCVAPGAYAVTRVLLGSPLRGRTVRDGYDNAPRSVVQAASSRSAAR